MTQFSKMKMHTGWLANAYHPFFDESPIYSWGYMYYDLNGNYFQIMSEQHLLTDFFHNELYATQILRDIEILDYEYYVSNVSGDNFLDDELKGVVTARGYTFFYDFIKRNNTPTQFSTEIITLASTSDPIKSNNFILNNLGILDKVCEDIANKCRKLLSKENLLILPKDFTMKVNETFANKKDPPLNLHNKILNYANKSQTISEFFDKTFDFTQLPFSFLACKNLTHKEKEIIYLYYYGFSLPRIASILEISKRTVDKNLEHIRNKLQCENSSQIIPALLRFDKSIMSATKKS
ncbi:helix-turn-helix transcriptional regulator [Legionella qingyii]|uniref:Helix-turn-helix transcriptional regulator n=2 Tax=Legionella qingyii TaxID=2184757 RepID=A0A317U5V6_9GAMM|nr:helix-turn-helix transcriptional regulator [Legionella qingyii]PWY56177.1 helix-turn-helix transcriptional regulator [Legionella qingyii]RUR22205.1 helix-turn-helix transcriptional regulator [Legionella qingyii]RUR25803.1 helix-turn-helix transcriptional regulator [Legionella qingyii]